MIVIIGSSNAVNLTDGLDGLATGTVAIVVVTLSIMTYLTGNIKTAEYLLIPYIAHSAELTVFLSALDRRAYRFSLVQQQSGDSVYG